MGSKRAVNSAALGLVSVVMERKKEVCGSRPRPRLGHQVRKGERIECVALLLIS